MEFRKVATLYCLIFLLSSAFSQDYNTHINVIGNNTTLTTIDKKELVDIFRGRNTFWDNDIRIKLVLPSQNHEFAEEIAEQVYNLSHTKMRKFWLSMVFQGRTNPPIFMDSDEEMEIYVKKNQGAIAVLGQATENSGLTIKVID